MNKKMLCIFGVLLLQLGMATLFAESLRTSATNDNTGTTVDIEVTQGLRQDKLKWSISGKNHKPDIISEITFKNITIYETRLITKFTRNSYFSKINLGYGDILDRGHVYDSDFHKSNREGEFSRSKSKIKGSHALDAQVSFGEDIAVSSRATISPLLGYLWQYEKLRFKNGRQTRLFGFKLHEKIKNLNSTYTSQWDGPFIGVRANFDFTPSFFCYGEYDFAFALRYHAHGFWNLRNKGKGMHFHQHSNRIKGFGQSGLVGLGYEVLENLILKAEYQLLRFEGRGGSSKAREGHKKFHQPFHKATLDSSEGRLCLDYSF